jgi:O-antigen ligase
MALVLFVVIFFNPTVGLMLLFFVIPFEYMVPYPIFKIIALVFLISWLARKAIKKEGIRISFRYPQEKYLIGLIFAITLSLVFSIDKGSSLLFFQRFVLLVALCIFLIDSINSPKDLRNLGWVIGLSGGLASLVGLMQYYVFDTGVLAASDTIGLVREYQFAIYLAVSICFLLYCFSMTRNMILRILIIVLIGCSIASIVLTLSRAGLLSLGVAIVIYTVRLKGFKFAALLTLPIIILTLLFILTIAPDFVYNRLINLTFYEQDVSRENRSEVIVEGIHKFFENPHMLITGVGLNNFTKVSWKKKDAHNTFLKMLFETGLIGFTFFFLLIYRSYRDIWHATKLKQVELRLFCLASLSAFTAIIVQGLFNDNNYVKYLWLFFVLVPILNYIKRKDYAPT